MMNQHATLNTDADLAADQVPAVGSTTPTGTASGPTDSMQAVPGTIRRRRISRIGVSALERASLVTDLVQSASAPVQQQPIMGPILFVTAKRRGVAEMENLIGLCGYSAAVVRTLEKAAQDAHVFRWNCMIVDLDSLNDVNGAVDALANLRKERPNLLVILLSKQVKRDDFSLERLALCDVTLRLPVGSEDLAFALQEARVNNQVWVMRCRQMKLQGAAAAVARVA